MTKRAVVLLSGGLDSATTLAIALDDGYEVWALSFIYGQKGYLEIEAAKNIARSLNVKNHKIIEIDLKQFGGSALTDAIPVPTGEPDSSKIPVTYVPARNTIFLSFALGLAEVLEASDIFAGVNTLDYSGYPDCRQEFIDNFEKMANVGTKAGVEGKPFKIHAPLMHMRKSEIIKKGLELGVDYSLSLSCYQPDGMGKACGLCESCRLRLQGFKELGRKDPAVYVKR